MIYRISINYFYMGGVQVSTLPTQSQDAAKIALAEQDRDSWKSAHKTTLDAANNKIAALEAELKRLLQIEGNPYIEFNDSRELYARSPEYKFVKDERDALRVALKQTKVDHNILSKKNSELEAEVARLKGQLNGR